MTGNATKDWAEAHWAPLTGENTELTQFNIWHHRRFGFVDHRDSACGNRWLAWTASRKVLVIELPKGDSLARRMYGPQACAANPLISRFDAVEAIEAAGLKVKS